MFLGISSWLSRIECSLGLGPKAPRLGSAGLKISRVIKNQEKKSPFDGYGLGQI